MGCSIQGVSLRSPMALLRSVTRLALGVQASKPALNLVRPASPSLNCFSVRQFANRSLPRRGHNLEDYYDMAESVLKMNNPLSEYFMWFVGFSMGAVVIIPLAHSNYYFTGRFFPSDQGNTHLCDDSW